MSLFLYWVKIWGAAFQGKYLDPVDIHIRFLNEPINNLYIISKVIKNWDC